jgi:hypothetical protein
VSIQQYLDELRHRFDRQHLPPAYANRVLAELADHLYALRDEAIDAGVARDEAAAEEIAQQRLSGDAEALAAAFAETVIEPPVRLLGFAGRAWDAALGLARRHALSAFGLLPILLMLGVGYGCKYLGILTYSLIVDVFHVDHMNPVLRAVVHYAFYGTAYCATPVLAVFFCVLAHAAGRSNRLALVACTLLSLGGGMLKLDLVQCLAGRDVAYFQRYGPHPARLCLPLLVFAAYACFRSLWTWRDEATIQIQR